MTRKTDPLVHSSFREALLVAGIWLTAAIWSISVCYTMGYHRSAADLKLVWGFPDWVFWGIVVPWATSTVVSIVFGLIFVATEIWAKTSKMPTILDWEANHV